MSSRSMALDVLVRLRDRLSAPMRRLRDNIRSLVNVGRQIGVVGTAIAAISFLGPIQQAAAFEQKLLDIAGTANLSGDAAFKFAETTRRKYEDLALAVGQTSDTIAAGAGQMIAVGLDEGLIDRNLGTIGKAATAANAEFSDLAAVSTSLLRTLNVPETELEGALAGLVVAGKEGAFELKDMARYFPQLTGQMQKFGIEGREASNQLAAMLQIARLGTSDPAQAATNLNNFLSKALAPVTQKNFRDLGVDIEAVMMDAAAKGINPIEAMLQKIGALTGVSGDTIGQYMSQAEARGLEGGDALAYVREQLEAIGAAGKIGQLFGDQQVLDFLIPMMANVEEYKRIRDEVAAATGATIDADYETQMKGLNVQLRTLREIGIQAARDVGFAFGEWLPSINTGLQAALKWIRELDEATGGWVRNALVAAGGGILFAGALGALALALPIVGAGLSAIVSLIAVALGPIGLVVAALALGAAYISKNWDRFGPRIMRAWDRTKRAFTDFGRSLVDGGQEILRRGRDLASRYGPMIENGIGRAWTWASEQASAAWARMPAMEDLTLSNVRDWWQGIDWTATATDAGKALADGIAAGWRLQIDSINLRADMLAWLADQIDQIDAGALGERVANLVASAFRIGMETIGTALAELGRDGGAAGLADELLDAIGNALEAGGEVIKSIMRKLFDFNVGFWSTLLGPQIEAIKSEFASIDLTQVGIDAINSLLSGMKQAAIDLMSWIRGLASDIAGSIGGAVSGALGGGKPSDGSKPSGNGTGAPANDDMPDGVEGRRLRRRSSIQTPKKMAAVAPAKADVSGVIRIAVEGPGKVTEAASSNRRVALTPERGRAVARA